MRSEARTILKSALLAGTLDLSAASVEYMIYSGGSSPTAVYRYIASGIFGSQALTGGWGFNLLGVLFHYCIAAIWSGIFLIAYRRFSFLREFTAFAGVVYACIIWPVMTLVVLPLSNVRLIDHTLVQRIIALLTLVVCIGLPIALVVRRDAQRVEKAAPMP